MKKYDRNKTPEYMRCLSCVSVYEEDSGEAKCLLNNKNPFQNRECSSHRKDFTSNYITKNRAFKPEYATKLKRIS